MYLRDKSLSFHVSIFTNIVAKIRYGMRANNSISDKLLEGSGGLKCGIRGDLDQGLGECNSIRTWHNSAISRTFGDSTIRFLESGKK